MNLYSSSIYYYVMVTCFNIFNLSDSKCLMIFSSSFSCPLHFPVVEYGIERINKEVSEWMRGLNENDSTPKIPFIATRGYDSVVWNRLYSRDTPDLAEYQAKQVSTLMRLWYYSVINRKVLSDELYNWYCIEKHES